MPLEQVFNRQANVVADVAQVNNGATFTSVQFSTNNAGVVCGTLFADQAGNVLVDQSQDGTNYDVTDTTATVASTGKSFSSTVVAPFARVRWTNTGASPTTIKRLYVNIRSI